MSKITSHEIPETMEEYGARSPLEVGARILYVDMNSCFASVEQQARPNLRNKPVVITNRLVKRSTIIAASVEAKELGIRVGMRVEEAKAICPEVIAAETEPSKYIFVHQKLREIMQDYSSSVTMKSIDEGLIDLTESPADIQNMPMQKLADELKSRVRDEIGGYLRNNVGFGPNRFYAKLAADLHKPNGCDYLCPENATEVFKYLELTNLPGINKRMERRLNMYQIYTPDDLLGADCATLEKQVCQSIEGRKWYDRLRGKEVDMRESKTCTVGRQFVLPPGAEDKDVRLFLAHLCEDVGFRLRSQGLYAKGLEIWRNDRGRRTQKVHRICKTAFCSDQDIMRNALELYDELKKTGRIIGVTLYKLQDRPDEQTSIFQEQTDHQREIAKLTDDINKRFGARTIHSATTIGTDAVKCKIPFGSTKYLGK